MKKKLIIIFIIIIGLILLIPIPMKLRDGGSIEFKAVLYKITKYHRLASTEEGVEYIDGIAIEILGKEIYNNTSKSAVKEKETFNTEGVTTALTLEDEIQDDTIWCGTFQLIWNDLKNDLAKQDIVFTPQLKVIENLNKETFRANDLSDKYFYKKVGTPSIKLKEEIEKALQTIQFELDKTGGKIKSEAGMMVNYESAMMIDEIREFAIDDTFAIFLKEEGKDNPYFAGKISDITKFQ